jgi:hypothetical protein
MLLWSFTDATAASASSLAARPAAGWAAASSAGAAAMPRAGGLPALLCLLAASTWAPGAVLVTGFFLLPGACGGGGVLGCWAAGPATGTGGGRRRPSIESPPPPGSAGAAGRGGVPPGIHAGYQPGMRSCAPALLPPGAIPTRPGVQCAVRASLRPVECASGSIMCRGATRTRRHPPPDPRKLRAPRSVDRSMPAPQCALNAAACASRAATILLRASRCEQVRAQPPPHLHVPPTPRAGQHGFGSQCARVWRGCSRRRVRRHR